MRARGQVLLAPALFVVGCAGGVDETGSGGSSTTTSGSWVLANTSSSSSNECAGIAQKAELTPATLFLLVDRSGSLQEGGKWAKLASGIKDFLEAPASDGMNVGLNFFPKAESAQLDSCDFHLYQELDVTIGTLPAHVPALFESIDDVAPQGQTPTFGALKGTLITATAYKDMHPDTDVAVVLSTDGLPNACLENSVEAIAQLAAVARAYNKVKTYVVAVGEVDALRVAPIALAGGTEVFDLTQDPDALSVTLARIHFAAVECSIELPSTPAGEELDLEKVNVKYTSGANMPTNLVRVNGVAGCGVAPAWYYSGTGEATKIVLCPSACSAVGGDRAAQLDVVFGCATFVP